MIQGLLAGTILFAAFAYYLITGVQYYALHEGMKDPFGLYAVVLGVLLTTTSIFIVRLVQLARARRWPYVTGIIQEVERSNRGWRIVYTYRVNDTPYRNDVFSLNSPLADPTDVALHITRSSTLTPEDLIDRRVRVFYNPADAVISVLARHNEPDNAILIIPAAVSIGIYSLLTYIMLSTWR